MHIYVTVFNSPATWAATFHLQGLTQFVLCLCVTKQWYGCQCLEFFACTKLLKHVVVHGGCTDTERESALKDDSKREKKNLPFQGVETLLAALDPTMLNQESYILIPPSHCVMLGQLGYRCFFLKSVTLFASASI